MKNFRPWLIVFTLFLVSAGKAEAAGIPGYKLELADPNQTICNNSIFQVKVYINTDGQEAIGGDVLLNFDPAKLNIQSGESANFFTYSLDTPLSGVNNKYLISSWEESTTRAKTSGDFDHFYTLNVKAVSAGSSQLTFNCINGTEADTNINLASDSTDIVACPLPPITIPVSSSCQGGGPTSPPPPPPDPTTPPVQDPTATPGQGGNGIGDTTPPTATPVPPTPTSTPTPTPIPPTRTPTPTSAIQTLPRAGVAEVTLGALGLGSILTIVGLLFML